jgi:hypothetical protein
VDVTWEAAAIIITAVTTTAAVTIIIAVMTVAVTGTDREEDANAPLRKLSRNAAAIEP